MADGALGNVLGEYDLVSETEVHITKKSIGKKIHIDSLILHCSVADRVLGIVMRKYDVVSEAEVHITLLSD